MSSMSEDVNCFVDALVQLQVDDLFHAGRRGIAVVNKLANFKIPMYSHDHFVAARALNELIDSCIIPFRHTLPIDTEHPLPLQETNHEPRVCPTFQCHYARPRFRRRQYDARLATSEAPHRSVREKKREMEK